MNIFLFYLDKQFKDKWLNLLFLLNDLFPSCSKFQYYFFQNNIVTYNNNINTFSTLKRTTLLSINYSYLLSQNSFIHLLLAWGYGFGSGKRAKGGINFIIKPYW